MATIKAFTSLEQSKKLAEILPLESADMRYISFRHRDDTIEWVPQLGTPSKYDFPCWTLAALLSVLPLVGLTMRQLIGTPKTLYRCIYNDDLKSHAYDNPIDACVAMIEKLHELKML